MIRVGVFGAGGRMGLTVCEAVRGAPDLELVAAVDPQHAGATVEGVAIAPDASALASSNADVAVDFTVADAARENIRWCAADDVHAVVGTSGLGEAEMTEFDELFAASKANAVIASNFAIGAVLMMRFAELGAPFFESVEVIETHHERKIDAPSGTAITTAQRIAAASKDWVDDPTTTVNAESARGAVVAGIPVHALRVRGMVASQEVLFGTTGQSLSIRHDTYDRSSFMPGVLMAVRKVGENNGLTVGLDRLLGL